jgi:hypothetical protein
MRKVSQTKNYAVSTGISLCVIVVEVTDLAMSLFQTRILLILEP